MRSSQTLSVALWLMTMTTTTMKTMMNRSQRHVKFQRWLKPCRERYNYRQQNKTHAASLLFLYIFNSLILDFQPNFASSFALQERNLQNLFSEVYAENDQLLSQLGTAKNMKTRV